jgi:group I intron endonuclease
LQRSYDKYGAGAFEFIIVEVVQDLDLLLEKETAYIAKHRSTEEEFGYNQCSVGRSAKGRKHSPETIEKIRASNLGKKRSAEARLNNSNARKGKKLSEETRLKIGLGHTGIKHPPRSAEFLARIRVINTELANRRWAKYREDKLNQSVTLYEGLE